ncbi:pleiotropic regulator 1 [Cryptosporidium xiaoi]|uniref:Pleiotropic regulator 1 n=1 Tax=Cryptosporidium xiaoi TaxID=659607 RepID=A0AAV9XZ52_9CRYT
MPHFLEKVVLRNLNFFSSENGSLRETVFQDYKFNKSYKSRTEYCNTKGNNYSSNGISNRLHSPLFFADKNPINTLNSEYGQKSTLSLYNSDSITNGSRNNILERPVEQDLNVSDDIWKPKFKLNKVITGHKGWVRTIDVNINNDFFVTGSSDKLIKFWDLSTGHLKLTLIGHVSTVRKVLFSERHPYLFTCSEDKTAKCWDLEQNRVVRNYARHSSGIYCLDIHPRLDIIATGSRDGIVILWDIRTKEHIYRFMNHKGAVSSLIMQSIEPQLVSGSYDRTIRTWDIVAGKTRNVLTHHSKPIRSLAKHPVYYSLLSAGADGIKVWEGENCSYQKNIIGSNSIINSIATISRGKQSVVAAGCGNGQLHFWDLDTGVKYDTIQSNIYPGSMESENSILDCKFDKSETILLTAECDKTIKIWNLIE